MYFFTLSLFLSLNNEELKTEFRRRGRCNEHVQFFEYAQILNEIKMESCHVFITAYFLFQLLVSTKCFVKDMEVVNIKGISVESKF